MCASCARCSQTADTAAATENRGHSQPPADKHGAFFARVELHGFLFAKKFSGCRNFSGNFTSNFLEKNMEGGIGADDALYWILDA
jgi:hypothetical protein